MPVHQAGHSMCRCLLCDQINGSERSLDGPLKIITMWHIPVAVTIPICTNRVHPITNVTRSSAHDVLEGSLVTVSVCHVSSLQSTDLSRQYICWRYLQHISLVWMRVYRQFGRWTYYYALSWLSCGTKHSRGSSRRQQGYQNVIITTENLCLVLTRGLSSSSRPRRPHLAAAQRLLIVRTSRFRSEC